MWTKGEQNCTIPYGDCNSLKRFTSAYLFLIVRQKSCEYLLIIFMQKYHQLSALISLFCTLISLGSIDVLSANQCAEIFACILLQVSNCFVPVSRPMWRNPDSGIQQMRGFGIRNPLRGIQDPLFGIRNPRAGIGNPRATLIPLNRAMLQNESWCTITQIKLMGILLKIKPIFI